jgi:hypothetical protein
VKAHLIFLLPVFLASAHYEGISVYGISKDMHKEQCSIQGTVSALLSSMPLDRAEITIQGIDSKLSSLMVTATDASGQYTVDLSPGSYSIRAERRGYVPQMYGEHRRTHEGVTLKLEPGARLQGIDFRLVPTGVIAGKVFDQDNDPIVGAMVQAVTPRYVKGERRLIGAVEPVKTNDLGEYRIYGLAPDSYYIGVSGQDPQQGRLAEMKGAAVVDERYLPTLYPSVTDLDQAKRLEIQPGATALGIDIAVSKSRTFHVRGKIVGVGPSYQYTRVKLEAVGVGWEISSRGAEIAPDSQGNFEFAGVTPGSYIISSELFQKGHLLSVSQLTHIQDKDLDGLILVPNAGVLRGHVGLDRAQNLDLRKVGIQLASEYSWPVDGTVASDGTFAFHGLGHYTYRLEVSGTGDFYPKSIRLADQELNSDLIDLSNSDEPSSVLEILLSDDGGRIDGVVQNENGAAARDATVVLVPDLKHRHESYLFKIATTNQNGQFSMWAIRPGTYKLFAWDDIEPGVWWDSEFLSNYENKGEEVMIEPRARLGQIFHLISAGAH